MTRDGARWREMARDDPRWREMTRDGARSGARGRERPLPRDGLGRPLRRQRGAGRHGGPAAVAAAAARADVRRRAVPVRPRLVHSRLHLPRGAPSSHPRSLEMPREAPRCDDPEMAPRWARDGPEMAPRWPREVAPRAHEPSGRAARLSRAASRRTGTLAARSTSLARRSSREGTARRR